MEGEQKRCTDCGIEKPLREFHRHRNRPDQRHGRCKDCRKQERTPERRKAEKVWREANAERRNEVQREWSANHLEHRREYAMVKRYGITPAQRDEMLAAQGGVCAICRVAKPARRWAIDHNHACCPGDKTCGQCIRGILCERCNTGIGSLQDDPRILEAAITYLTE